MKEKYWAIFDVKDWFPMMTKKAYTVEELNNIWKKSKVDIAIEELGWHESYYVLGGYTSVGDKEIAEEIWEARVREWWEKNKEQCCPGMLEDILGNRKEENDESNISD